VTSRYFGLVPAAGSGSRFGSEVLKQYSPLAGKPMLYHSIARLLATPEVEIAFVVLAPGDTEFRRHDWSAFGTRLAPLYCGGASRRDSVLNGIIAAASLVDPNDWILVHDAVRPCLGTPELRRLIDEAGADEVRIAATEPRDGLWRAQTPQMFRYSMLLRALREAEHVTDEASAVEALGYKPKLVEGSTKNMKVTFPADLEIAEKMLRNLR